MDMSIPISDNPFRPLWEGFAVTVKTHKVFWGKTFWKTWEDLPLDHKLAWLLVINHTIAILTLIEILVFKKR